MSEKQKLFCLYSNERFDDSGIEALKLYIPTCGGYINYNIAHSVMKSTKCDTWRLSVVYYCDGDFAPIKPLTRSGAEWEMALKIKGRPDFIGGYAHGDEVFEKIAVKIDGSEIELENLCELTAFKELSFEVWSRGFDPVDSKTEALLHYKKITVSGDGVKVEQRVEWLNDYELTNSYMAMMPPFKEFTDHYYTNADQRKRPIVPGEVITNTGDINSLCLCGSSGFTFEMKAVKYLTDKDGKNTFLVTDNGGVPYNKMYFYLNHNGAVRSGEVWETETEYTVKL
jgi:hypothetical protein